MAKRVFIHDVVARDGLQIEPNFIPTERKIELIDLLSATGVAKIEATSFVSPKAVPNLRDAAEVMAGIRRNPAVTYVALIPNARGAERALAAEVDEVVMVVSASETHNRANVRRSVAQSFEGFREVFDVLRGSRTRPVGAVATAFGCPFEGVLPERRSSTAWHGTWISALRRDLRRYDRHGRSKPGRAAGRRRTHALAGSAANPALPQHARHGTGERARRSLGGRGAFRGMSGWARRVSVCAGRNRERLH